MSRFVIRDETVAAAFELLQAHDLPAAAARADRLRREDMMKASKATAFLAAAGTVAEREAMAILTDEYVRAAEAHFAAVELDESYRNQRATAELTIEAWRTTSANKRAT